jgi:ABC-type transport system substrate-binding protein
MNTTARLGAVVLLVLSAACGSSGLTSSTGTSPTAALPLPTPPRTFSPLSGPSRTFIFDRELSYRVTAYTRESRFVLYDNGAFVLQYVGLGLEYRGGYTEENGRIAFEWEGWSAAGPWGATGAVQGDSLTVQYNLIMQLTDFEDAVYALMR